MYASLRNSALAFVAALLSLSALAQSVGRIDYATGIVRIERGTQILAGIRGTELVEGDVVATGPGTQVQIRMTDDAFLALRPNTRLTLDKYRFNRPREADGVLVSLAHGVMRAFTGAIAERNRESFVMKTPLATVGIRGSGNILAHLGEEGTVNHTITGAHSITALDELGRPVTVVTRPGQTVQVRPGVAPRFIATPSYIFAAASSAPPAQVAATSSATTPGTDTSERAAGGSTSGTDRSAGGGETSSSTTASTASERSTTGTSGTERSPGGGATTTTGGSSSPSSNVQTAVAPANVRTSPGVPGGGNPGGGGGGGASVAIVANVAHPGGRAAIFATEQDPGYTNIGRDSAGFLTSASGLDYRSMPDAYHPDSNLTDATVQISGGTPSDYFANVEQNIKMGRLQNASIAVTGEDCACGTTASRTDVTAPGGLVFIVYDEAPRGVILSYTGTTSYRLDGSTRPIDARGNVGTLNSATLNANFTDRTLDFTFSLAVNSLVYSANASNVSFDGVRFFVHHTGTPSGLQVSCSGAGCRPSYAGAVNGSFAGNGTTAWLAYHLFPTDNSDLVNGAIALAAVTTPLPRFTLPATGTWNMVMIDNYPTSGPGFPAFSTNANAHINFGTRRADFTFTLNRVLTPADVSAGFQPQSVTASASNLPMQGVGFVAQTGSATRPSTLNVTCTGCGPAPPVGRFEGYLSYVDPSSTGGNVNIYWYLTNNTSGTLGYDYAGSTYFGNAPTTLATVTTPAVTLPPARLAKLPDVVRGPLRPPR